MSKNKNNMNLFKLTIVKVRKFSSTEPIFGGFKPFGTTVRSDFVVKYQINNRGDTPGVFHLKGRFQSDKSFKKLIPLGFFSSSLFD